MQPRPFKMRFLKQCATKINSPERRPFEMRFRALGPRRCKGSVSAKARIPEIRTFGMDASQSSGLEMDTGQICVIDLGAG